MEKRIGRIEKEFMLRALFEDGAFLSFSAGDISVDCQALAPAGGSFRVRLAGGRLPHGLPEEATLEFGFRGGSVTASCPVLGYAPPFVTLSLDGDWIHEVARPKEPFIEGAAMELSLRVGDAVMNLGHPRECADGEASGTQDGFQAFRASLAELSRGLGIELDFRQPPEASAPSSLEAFLHRESKALYLPDAKGSLPATDLSPYPDMPFLTRGGLDAFVSAHKAMPGAEALSLPAFFRGKNVVAPCFRGNAFAGTLTASFGSGAPTAQALSQALQVRSVTALCAFFLSPAARGEKALCLDFRPTGFLAAIPDAAFHGTIREGMGLSARAAYPRREVCLETRAAAVAHVYPWTVVVARTENLKPEDARFLFETTFGVPLRGAAAEFLLQGDKAR